MCGIAGIVGKKGSLERQRDIMHKMLSSLQHRGPDDCGIWQQQGITIGHRRLSIIDLSTQGHQPMLSTSGRFVMAYNGEIYNHLSLRKDLQSRKWKFRGHSDAEVLLAMIDDLGLKSALQHCVGMFAVALWDNIKHSLTLVRDRFGEKPLYYGWNNGQFLFASELKAFVTNSDFNKTINRQAVQLFLRYGYIPDPLSIYSGIYKLEPGSLIELHFADNNGCYSKNSTKQSQSSYWNHLDIAINGLDNPFKGNYEDAKQHLDDLLKQSIGLQCHADVPVGAFLSGGVDSSMIVALAQQQSPSPLHTFSIGFDDIKYDEAVHAKKVAEYIGTNHHEFYLSSNDVATLLPELGSIYDEPFADSSQIPACLIAKWARKTVKVSLSGDGGDEIFYGYHKYPFGQKFSTIPLRKVFGQLVGGLPWQSIEKIAKLLFFKFGDKFTTARFNTLYELLSAKNNLCIAERVAIVNDNTDTLCYEKKHKFNVISDILMDGRVENNYPLLAMVLDKITYLPGDILTKVDRATMAASLESRAPLLDHRLSEFVATLPNSYLFNENIQKKILRDLLYKYVPRKLVDRPKAGFSIPLANWLRSDLSTWARDLLSSNGGTQDGFLKLDEGNNLLSKHLSGKVDASATLWTILMFQTWRKHWL